MTNLRKLLQLDLHAEIKDIEEQVEVFPREHREKYDEIRNHVINKVKTDLSNRIKFTFVAFVVAISLIGALFPGGFLGVDLNPDMLYPDKMFFCAFISLFFLAICIDTYRLYRKPLDHWNNFVFWDSYDFLLHARENVLKLEYPRIYDAYRKLGKNIFDELQFNIPFNIPFDELKDEEIEDYIIGYYDSLEQAIKEEEKERKNKLSAIIKAGKAKSFSGKYCTSLAVEIEAK